MSIMSKSQLKSWNNMHGQRYCIDQSLTKRHIVVLQMRSFSFIIGLYVICLSHISVWPPVAHSASDRGS